MATRRTPLETIEDFLDQGRIAMVGISRNPREFSRMLFDEMCRRGYDMIPVNPAMPEIPGQRCFARVQDIPSPADAALLMTSPAVTDVVVRDCAEAGIRRVWMYSASGAGAVSQQAIDFCRQHGIQVVEGECPYMFFPRPGLHGIHGFLRKLTGQYPRHTNRTVA